MPPQITALIHAFRVGQDRAVEILTSKLSFPKPESNVAWAVYCSESGLHGVREKDGVSIYAHGYGVELSIDGSTLDFDWGDRGEPDGFDAWRLFVFCEDNCPGIDYTHNQLRDLLDEAHLAGELLKDTHLYYDPRHRASA